MKHEYDILETATAAEMVSQVRARIALGWIPRGGLTLIKDGEIAPGQQALEFYQVVTRSSLKKIKGA